MSNREQLLAADWRRQATLDAETRAELARLFAEQSRLLVEQQQRTRKRVLAELAGLAVVAIGTVVGTLGQ